MRRILGRLTTGLLTAGVLAGGMLGLTAVPALAAAPSVVGESVSGVTPFEAHLEATVKAAENPNSGEEPTECHFDYGTTSVSEHREECEQGNALEGGEQGIGKTITGLSPNIVYHYRVVVKDTSGEGIGTGAEFTTLTPEKPVVEGENASGADSTGAVLETQVNPNYQKTEYGFELANNKALTGAITVKGPASLEGFGAQTGSVTLSALAPGEIYYYRALAKNATGTTVDSTVQAFSTLPTPFTEAPVGVSGTGALFLGRFTLAQTDTKYSFDYKRGGECTGEDSTPMEDAGTGSTAVMVAWGVPNEAPPLYPNTEYTVCLVTSNAYGSQLGSPEHFTTTSAAPTVGSESIDSEGPAGIVVEAKIDPNLQETTYFAEYATTEASLGTPAATKVPGTGPLAAELRELPVSVSIDVPPLPGTTYYYRVGAENESTVKEGTPAFGETKSYALPVVSTGPAASIVQTAATLSGTVDPEGAETTYYFEYISREGYEKAQREGDAEEKADPYMLGETTPTFKITEPGNPSPYTGAEPQPVEPVPATGLQPGQTYYYALVAKSPIGVTTGSPEHFTTAGATPPVVSTGGASGISQNSASLSGAVSTNGLQTNYGFEIATEPGNYGPATGLGAIGGAATEEVHVTLGELQPGTTYYYRVTATNADGTSHGEPATFTTSGFPTLIASSITPPVVATPNIVFPIETANTGTRVETKKLTNKQKLAKALAACHKKHGKKRSNCVRHARKEFGQSKKVKK
jgi:phosphodiesterase/alkaline phosphatase D-like protein